MMLFLRLLCLSGLVTATPIIGSWHELNIFSWDSEQLPLRTTPKNVKDTLLEGIFPEEKHQDTGTIWEVISNDSSFKNLTQAIKFADAIHHFDDKDAQITFFATPDWALPHPHRRCDKSKLSRIDQAAEISAASFDLARNCHWDDVISVAEEIDASSLLDDKDKEHRKKLLKMLVRAILAYQILPEAINIHSLGYNTTHATMLAIPGVLEGQPLRVRVEQKLLPPSTRVNFYAKVVHSDLKASNGVIHVMNHPVLPPLSAFQTLYLIPEHFSFLTSAVQRVGLTDDVDLRFKRGDPHEEKWEGASSLTFFAPVNSAFEALPPRLKYFLFSPLGQHVLRKLLEYHIVPGLVIHSDYQFNRSAHVAPDNYADQGQTRSFPHGKLISNIRLHLPTLFDNRTVLTHIKRTEVTLPAPTPNKPTMVETRFSVGHRGVLVRDVVASNGAIHALDRLLDPRCPRDHDDGYWKWMSSSDWNDWEEWLPQWAYSN